MSEKLTIEDKRMIDLTYWSDWEEKKHMVLKEYPAIWTAFFNYKSAEQALDFMCKMIADE